MPIWAWVYCICIAVFAVWALGSGRKPALYHIPGECLSALLTVLFFLIYFDQVEAPASSVIPVLMFAYVIYWKLWENRHQLRSVQFAIAEEHAVASQQPSTESAIAEERAFILLRVGFVVLFLLPFVFVSLRVIASYS